MSIARSGFGLTLSRAVAMPLLVFTAAASLLVPSAVSPPPMPRGDAGRAATLWKAAYSKRYPGCVSTLLWPTAETPVALVVRGRDGRLSRLTSAQARHLLAAGEQVRAIGVCRAGR